MPVPTRRKWICACTLPASDRCDALSSSRSHRRSNTTSHFGPGMRANYLPVELLPCTRWNQLWLILYSFFWSIYGIHTDVRTFVCTTMPQNIGAILFHISVQMIFICRDRDASIFLLLLGLSSGNVCSMMSFHVVDQSKHSWKKTSSSPYTKEAYTSSLSIFYAYFLLSFIYDTYSMCCLCSLLHLNASVLSFLLFLNPKKPHPSDNKSQCTRCALFRSLFFLVVVRWIALFFLQVLRGRSHNHHF